MTIPTTEPSEFTAGDSLQWTRAFSDYLPADGWALTYYFVNSTGKVTVTTSDNGDGSYLASISTAVSATFAVGRWYWQAVATRASERVTLDSGETVVVTGFVSTAAGGADVRSPARKTLDALEATLQGRATSDHLSMSVNGRSISRLSVTELLQWRDRLRDEVRIEEQGERAGLGRNIKVRFGRG